MNRLAYHSARREAGIVTRQARRADYSRCDSAMFLHSQDAEVARHLQSRVPRNLVNWRERGFNERCANRRRRVSELLHVRRYTADPVSRAMLTGQARETLRSVLP